MRTAFWEARSRKLDRLRTVDALARLSLSGCPRGRGRNYARVVWLALAASLKWGGLRHRTWISDEGISRRTGLKVREVELGIAYLHRVGKVTRSYGWRGAGGARAWRRTITMCFEGLAPVVRLPKPAECREMLRRIRQLRKRPMATFAVAFAAHVLARSEHRSMKSASKVCRTQVGQLAKLIGMSRGGGFNDRLQILRDVGVLERPGSSWRRGFVLFVDIAETLRDELASLLPAAWSRRDRPEEPQPEALLAAMAEAFAAQYPGSTLAAAG